MAPPGDVLSMQVLDRDVLIKLGIMTVRDLHMVHAASIPAKPRTAPCCRACSRLSHAPGHVRYPGVTRRRAATAPP